MKRPLQVGITGGIGAGKSLVCHIFQCLGVPVYDADSQAKRLMTTDPVLVEQIKSRFGPQAYREGSLDREFLGRATFGHPDKLSILNGLVHPQVMVDYVKWSEANKNHPYLLREAALLYEAGSFTTVDKMIVVSAPDELRIARIKSRDPHRSQDDIKAIMKSQWPEEEKIKRADFVIYNDDRHMVIPQVLQLHSRFTGKQAAS